LLAAEAAGAEMPAALLRSTVAAAAGRTLAGTAAATALSGAVLRTMFMTKLKIVSAALLVIGAGAGTTAVMALQQVGKQPDAVRADRGLGGSDAPPVAEAKQTPETAPPESQEAIDREIMLAELNKKRAENRVDWSDRMFEKGYVSKAQNVIDKDALRQATLVLERALAKRKTHPQGQTPGNQETGKPQRDAASSPSEPAPSLADLNRTWPRDLLSDAMLAGLPQGSQPPVLDWERIYALALYRSRGAGPPRDRTLAGALVPKAIEGMIVKYDIRNFARFRSEFLSGRGDAGGGEAGFHDPAGEVLELLCRRQEVENARSNTSALENVLKVVRGLLVKQSEYLSSTGLESDLLADPLPLGVSQLELDLVDATLQGARLRLVDLRERYRDQLDVLKVHLGLMPHVPIALDRAALAGFRDAFDEVDRWRADRERLLTALPRIAGRLPALGDVVIDGHTILVGQEDHQELTEERLSAAVRIALETRARTNPGNSQALESDQAPLELRVRGTIRRMLRIRLEYAVEQRRFVLVTRRRDQAQERLLAPPGIASSRRDRSLKEGADVFADLLGAQAQTLENQDRLVSLWTEYQTLRLGLFRDLGTLPCDDWKSFYDQLTARRASDAR
jgi:hypothetical protein